MVARLVLVATVLLALSVPSSSRPDASQDQPIRVGVELITVDAVVRDRDGRFVPNLVRDDFELNEDDVRQTIVSFLLSHGGRVINPVYVLPPRGR